MIRIDLDTIRKDLGRGCWTRIPRATVATDGRKGSFVREGASASLQAVCAALSELGVEGQARAYRGKTEIFAHPLNIESMAEGVASPRSPKERAEDKA